MEKKIRIGIYFAWDYDREEAKVNSMAKDGWQLKKGGLFHHTYERSNKSYRYKIDYNSSAKFNYESYRRYITLFEEQGWELINSTFNGWYYFRKPYIEGSNENEYELYTDDFSLRDMLSRWTFIAKIIQVYFTVFFVLNLIHFILEKRYFNGFAILGSLFGILVFQSGITSMKRKSVREENHSAKRINVSLLLFIGMLLSIILMVATPNKYHYDYWLKYTQLANNDTEKRIETFTIEKDNSYMLDIKNSGDRGIIRVRILKDDSVIYNIGGLNYSLTTRLELKKGEYQIEIEYDSLDNLDKNSNISVFVGLR
jgi:hypothetical protein